MLEAISPMFPMEWRQSPELISLYATSQWPARLSPGQRGQANAYLPPRSPKPPYPVVVRSGTYIRIEYHGVAVSFEAARQMQKPPVVVSACSSAEYGHVPQSAIPVKEDQPLHPLHPYGISKVCLDLLAREYFLDYRVPAVNLRLFNTTGPGKTADAPSDFVRQLAEIKLGKRSPVIEVGNLKPRRAFLDVRDTVRAFYLAALKGKPGEAYNVCATVTHESVTCCAWPFAWLE